jgi:hypothetical protein
MKRKKTGKTKVPTYAEWYEAHREQFERTERHYEELRARWASEAAARGTAHEDAAA